MKNQLENKHSRLTK